MISPSAAAPQPFGKYLLDREIARGGMARVHLARLRGLGGFEKRLVVKQILPQLARDPRFVSMFVQEAKTLVQMSHPHIVPVYELGVVDGIYFLAMEYVEGATLAEIVADGPLDPAQVAHAGAQLCDALHYAHDRFGVVHRDVTPRNVIVDAAGHSRLLDFGIAAPVAEDAEGDLFGTPGYLSPEQARGETIGPRSDVFSLAAVLWHALVGAPAFDIRSVEAIKALDERSRPRLADRGLDPELASIIDQALAPSPEDRPETARVLGRALRGWLASRHPEGVAPELGVRAERARARREAIAHAPAQAEGTSQILRTPNAVKTLAQSQALGALLDAQRAESANDPGPLMDSPPGGVITEARGEPATVRIASRARTEDLESERSGAERNGAEISESQGVREGKRASHDARYSSSSGKRARWAPVIGIVLAAITAWLVVVSIGPAPARLRPEPIEVPLLEDAPRPSTTEEAVPETTESREDASQVPEGQPAGSPAGLPPVAEERTTPEPAARAERTSAEPALLSVAIGSGWARISIDGRPLGTTPIRSSALTPGWHTMLARNDALDRDASLRFRAEAGERIHARVELTAEPARIVIERR